ncbi:hypothetical protein FRC02_005470 [Tulasnella sp. 418]|nr:hypothetical protein FRC02_005470 [Tulasnella sp. 418]
MSDDDQNEKEQLIELLVQMKTILESTNNTQVGVDQVRAIMSTHPQLAYGLMKTMVMLDVINPVVFQQTLAGLVSQQATTAAPPHVPPAATTAYPAHGTNVAQPPYGQQQPTNPPPQAYPPTGSYPRSQPSSLQPAPQPIPSSYAQPAAPRPSVNAPASQTPQVNLPASVMNLPSDQKEVLMHVLSLTEDQLNNLPASERDAFIQIRRQFLGPSA